MSKTCIRIEDIEKVAPLRKPGYGKACIEAAQKDSPPGLVCLTWPDFFRLKGAYHIPPPSFLALASKFETALLAWMRAGFPVVAKAQWEARMETCRACPQWKEDARLGLGRCEACGCSKMKHWLATESCPLGKW
jgi:hypothetical protein